MPIGLGIGADPVLRVTTDHSGSLAEGPAFCGRGPTGGDISGRVMQISEQRGRGSEPQTLEDLFRCQQLPVVCISDIDGTGAFANVWIGMFTFTVVEASACTGGGHEC